MWRGGDSLKASDSACSQFDCLLYGLCKTVLSCYVVHLKRCTVEGPDRTGRILVHLQLCTCFIIVKARLHCAGMC